MKKVCVIGLGYIGLPTASLLAEKGYSVHGVDINPDIVNKINKGESHIKEDGLQKYVSKGVAGKLLKADFTPEHADIFIIAVPTPFKKNYEPDISSVKEAYNSIIPYIQKNNIVINESTSPIGTTEKMITFMKKKGINTDDIYWGYCPERVLPGRIIKELIQNDRVVGGINQIATEKIALFYSSFVKGNILKTDIKTAEITKLAENSFRDVNIAFANEISMLCDKFDIDVNELIKLANKHPRVNILNPGCGVGGHCIAVDPWFLINADKKSTGLIYSARKTNNYKTEWCIEKIKRAASEFQIENSKKPIIACMGLSFKPDVDDIRQSPALHITRNIIDSGFSVLPVEPNLDKIEGLDLIDYRAALEQADIIVFLVTHKEFKNLDTTGKIIITFGS